MSSTARQSHFGTARAILGFAAVIGALVLAGVALRSSPQAEKARVIPAPTTNPSANPSTSDVAVLAGGCFWGVTSAVSGYAGGQKQTAHYDIVGMGRSGHAESVEVTYDPRQVSYGQLLQVFFSVAHDPTQLNRQGPDYGTQYRSAIFPTSAEQARVAKAYIEQLNQARAFDRAIVTTIEMERPFYRAEDYHQDFLTLHPTYPYIVVNDLPKIGELKRVFPALYRDRPVLVGGTQ
jgi:peptide-methionine (S)-S-oxide reductase